MVLPAGPRSSAEGASEHRDVEGLRATLTLRPLGGDRFAAPTPGMTRRLFGGQVMAQCLRAAGATVEASRSVHSLHGYFVRGGTPDAELTLEVARTRDGRSFSTRHVTAVQEGRPILEMMASFHIEEPGADWQFQAPVDVPEPPDVPALRLPWPGGSAFDVRPVAPPADGAPPHPQHPFWIRLRPTGPLGPDEHTAMAVYLSDIALMGVPRSPVAPTDLLSAASLDHTVWFHRPVRVDDWLLYSAEPVINQGARGLARGSLFTRDGQLVASIAQEALLRPGSGPTAWPAPRPS